MANASRPIRRRRRTAEEMDAIRAAIYHVLEADQPMTVRQVFYRLTSAGVIPKLESEYSQTVVRLLGEMRRDGSLPFEWLADATRWMRKPTTFDSLQDALHNTAKAYRRDLWNDGDEYVEIWLEKEALAGVLIDVTDPWDVPLMVTRGYSSISYLHSAAKTIYSRAKQGKRTVLYYFGDRDPSGVDIDRSIREGIGESLMALERSDSEIEDLREHVADRVGRAVFRWNFLDDDELEDEDEEPSLADVEKDVDARLREATFTDYADFERVAVTEEQITDWDLQTRPTKKNDPRAKKFKEDESVELDAIPPALLRELAEETISRHVDAERFKVLQVAEESERRDLEQIAERLDGDGGYAWGGAIGLDAQDEEAA